MAKSSLTLKAARWSAEHPWRAVLIWVLFVAAALAIGSALPTQGTTNADYRVGDSGVADKLMAESGLAKPNSESVLVTAPSGRLPVTQSDVVARQLREGMSRLAVVRSVGRPDFAPRDDAMLVNVSLRGSPDGDDPDVTTLQAVTARVQAAHPRLSVVEVGDASINAAVGDRVGSDLGSAERISLPLTLLIMLLAFGALIAAGIPVLLAISAVATTIGLLGPISHLVPMDDTVSSMVLLIGMAVGVDYSLFYLKRAREERRRGHSEVDAVEIAAATSGHSIVVSAAAVIVSMAGLYLAQDVTFASLGTGAILVVAAAMMGSLTVLPALLVKLGRFVDRPRIPFLGKRMERLPNGALSRRLLAPVMRRPVAALVIGGMALVALALPATGMRLHEGTIATLPQDIPQVQTAERMERLFPSQGATLLVVTRTSRIELPRVRRALTSLNTAASGSAGFLPSARPSIRVSNDGRVAVLTLTTPYGEGDPRADASLATLRGVLGPRFLGRLPATQWVVGGTVAQSVDETSHQRETLPYVIGFVLLLTLLMMGITFRSVAIALVTTVLNLASVAAAFGVLTLIFQHTWAEGLLGFSSSGFVVDWIPLFTFVVLMGLSMDYHVFVLSRVREGVERGLPPRLAVEHGVSQTAGVVTSAAAVMVSVFAIFATLSLLELKQIGIGLAVSVLIDATVVRGVMLPAALRLMGRAAWWPGGIHRPVGTPVDVADRTVEQPRASEPVDTVAARQ
jgi:RND superfamily putative drug exporter